MKKCIWITWEKQRRSCELATVLGCKLFIFDSSGLLRYFRNTQLTFKALYKERPDILFVQNPSIILSFISVCFFKHIFSLQVIVDRHSNFLLTKKKRNLLFEFIFNFLSYTTIRFADLTIVTNEELAHVVKVLGGIPFILPDKIPLLKPSILKKYEGKTKILCISSFAEDEPIKEIFSAASKTDIPDLIIYISGNSSKLDKNLLKNIPDNIRLTGFLPDDDFIDLLFQVDAVLVLTKMEYTLLCGCYEALAAEKPFITSNTKVLKKLFKGALFVDTNPETIADGITNILCNLKLYTINSIELKHKLNLNWNKEFEKLKKLFFPT